MQAHLWLAPILSTPSSDSVGSSRFVDRSSEDPIWEEDVMCLNAAVTEFR